MVHASRQASAGAAARALQRYAAIGQLEDVEGRGTAMLISASQRFEVGWGGGGGGGGGGFRRPLLRDRLLLSRSMLNACGTRVVSVVTYERNSCTVLL
jgi:hypothetical protein